MARILSAGQAAKAATKLGTEPIIVLKIEWAGDKYYSDKDLSIGAITAEGRIMTLGAISLQKQQDSIGTSAVGNVTLDDKDGELKLILESTIINGKLVTVYHHYEGLTDTDLLAIFKGKIDSPIVWSEAERTLTFDIVSLIEGEDIGFAPDEDDLPGICEEAIDKPWPIIFGSPKAVPAVQIFCPATGILKTPVSRTSTSFRVERGEDFPQSTTIDVIIGGMIFQGKMVDQLFTVEVSNKPLNTNVLLDERDLTDSVDFLNPRVAWIKDPNVVLVGQFCFVEGTGIPPFVEGLMNLCIKQEGPKCFFAREWVNENDAVVRLAETDVIRANNEIFETAPRPRTDWTSQDLKIWDVGVGFEAQFGSNILLTWFWRPGSLVRQFNVSPKYVLHLGTGVAITEILGEKNVDGNDVLVPLPENYYTVNLTDTVAGQSAVTLTLNGDIPLEDRPGQGWSGKIFTTMDSGLGSNVVSDVLTHLITEFTSLVVDAPSFAAVAALVENYPTHFALFEAGNAIQILESIAFQARLGLRIEAEIVSIKYLSVDPGSTEDFTIAESEIDLKTIELTFSEKEDIFTKIKATWQIDYSGKEDSQKELLFKNNIDLFGVREKTIDFIIYSQESLVQKSLTFWGNRFSNMWRQVQLTTFLTTLKLELFDVLEFALTDTTLIPPTGIKGVIDDVTQDPNSNRIGIFCTLPSKAGTTTISSDFYLDDSGDVKPDPPNTNIEPTTISDDLQYNATYLGSTTSQDAGDGAGDGGGGTGSAGNFAEVASTVNLASLSGLQSIDGIAGVDGLRTLLKDQSTPSENGIYLQRVAAWEKIVSLTDADNLLFRTVSVTSGNISALSWYFVTSENVAQIMPIGDSTFAEMATTASITLSGIQSIDGVSGGAGKRVLVKNQGTASENGLYTMAAGAWTKINGFTKLGESFSVGAGTDNRLLTFIVNTTNLVFADHARYK